MGFGGTTIFFLLSAKATGTAQNSFHSTPQTPPRTKRTEPSTRPSPIWQSADVPNLALVVFH
jgi:hypothetical protein